MNISLFSERLKQIRQKRDLSYKQLSDLSGVTATALSNYEKNGKIPNLDSAVKIAQALQISLDWLCGIENQTNSKKDDSKTILQELSHIMDSFEFEIEHKSNENLVNVVDTFFKCSVSDNIASFCQEYAAIKQMEKITQLMTPEMKQDLISGLVKKYCNLICVPEKGEIFDIPEDIDF